MTGTVLPREYVGSVCEIKTSENTFITTGKISAVAADKIKISVKGKALKSVPYGYRVKMNIFNSKMGFRVIEGKVYTSGFSSVSITDVCSIIEKERRKSFRVDMNMASKAFFDNTYTGRYSSTEIIIKNMSLNGIKFTSRHHFDMGTVLNFGIQLNRRKSMDLECTIIRRGAEGTGGQMSYIGKIINSSENEDAVCSFLLQKQGEMLNNSK